MNSWRRGRATQESHGSNTKQAKMDLRSLWWRSISTWRWQLSLSFDMGLVITVDYPAILFGPAINNTYIHTVMYWLSKLIITGQQKHGRFIKITDKYVNIINFKNMKVMIQLKENFNSLSYILNVKREYLYVGYKVNEKQN